MQIMTPSVIDAIGFAASALVFLTFCMRTLLPLRLVALISNLLFIAYGLAAGLVPILVLHLLLLPMNLWRTAQQLDTRRRLRAALVEQPNLTMLLPFMTSETRTDGEVLFRKGDAADHFYVIADGEVMIEDVGKLLRTGDIFGEIAFFATDGKRNATARAVGPVRLGWIDREGVMQVCLDHPDFAIFLARLMVARLEQNQEAAAQQP